MQCAFITKVIQTVQEFKLLDPGDRVLAAVSGGPDSVALVLSLLALKDRYDLTVGIVHLNHQLRKTSAFRDEAFSADFARRLGLPFYCQQTDVSAYARDHGLSVEAAGRTVRYAFFNVVVQAHGYSRLATGHHRDDNAELVLMNLLRGAGPKGLGGIPPVRNHCIIRPLIQVSKAEILEFLADERQDFVTDDSNSEDRFLRNKIRHQLLPQLASDYNPKIVEALNRTSRILWQEEQYWQDRTEKQFNLCQVSETKHTIALSRAMLLDLDEALLKRLLRMAICRLKKNLSRISHHHIQTAIAFCFDTGAGTCLDLPGQIRIYKNKKHLCIKKEMIPLRELGKREKQKKRAVIRRQADET